MQVYSKNFILKLLVVVALVLAIYSPIFKSDIIFGEDSRNIYESYIESPNSLLQIWKNTALTNYCPVTLSSFWIEEKVAKDSALLHHLINIVLHLVNVSLIYLVLSRLGISLAWLVALIFAIHPVNVETVAWVFYRQVLISYLFTLLAIYYFIGDDKSYSIKSIFCFIIALFSKSGAVTLPILLLLITWWRHGEVSLKSIYKLTVYFLLSIISLIWFKVASVPVPSWEIVTSNFDPIKTFSTNLALYVSKTVLPIDLNFIYNMSHQQLVNFLGGFSISFHKFGVIILFILLITSIRLVTRKNTYDIGIFIIITLGSYLILVLPFLVSIDIGIFKNAHIAADHWQYQIIVPMLCFVVIIFRLIFKNIHIAEIAQYIFILILIGSLCYLSFNHTRNFQSQKVLWQNVIKKNPKSYLAQYRLAHHLYVTDEDSDINEISNLLKKVLKIKKDYIPAITDLAQIKYENNNYESAEELLRKVTEVYPNNDKYLTMLGVTLVNQNKVQESNEIFVNLIKLNPKNAKALYHLGRFELNNKNYEKAHDYFYDSYLIDDNDPDTLANLGASKLYLGYQKEALIYFQKSKEISPENDNINSYIAEAYLLAGMDSEAVKVYHESLEKNIYNVVNLNNYAWVLATSKDVTIRDGEKALMLARIAARLTKYENISVLSTLAAALAELGQFEDAVKRLNECIELAKTTGNTGLLERSIKRLEYYKNKQNIYE